MPMNENGKSMTAVHTCWTSGEADIVAGFLQAGGIEAWVNSEVPAAVGPGMVGDLAKYEVWVARDDAMRALGMLSEREKAAPADSPEGQAE